MDKETLSNYGWVVIAVLVLSIMIALATPFGQYIGNAVKSTTEGLFKVEQKALGVAGLVIGDQSFEDNGGGGTPEPVPAVPGATFTDGTFLTWEELKLEENGTKYGYTASLITDTILGSEGLKAGAFVKCTSLTSISLPDSLTSIGINTFFGCTSLTSIDLPDSLTSIGTWAFFDCTALTSVDLPDSITSIGVNTFGGCTSLTSIDLPDSITSIDSGAFQSCKDLTSINYAGSTSDWGNITLGSYWKYNVPATEVICSDGTVSLS